MVSVRVARFVSRRVELAGWAPAMLKALVAGACLLAATIEAAAARTAADLNEAQTLLQEALYAEIYGDNDRRESLLEQAIATREDFAPARWHAGYVQLNGKWVEANVVPQMLEEHRSIVKYRRLRAEMRDTAADHLQLANWARENKLPERERAHLMRVVEFEPNHREARERLGFRRVVGAWRSADELAEEIAEVRRRNINLAHWAPKLAEIIEQLDERSELRRRAAEERLRGIHDPAAIPALETALANRSQPRAELFVEIVLGMGDQDAALALARQSVFSPWPPVRQAAQAALRQRDFEAYVPALLASLSTPIETRTQLYATRNGQLMYRHVLAREGQDRWQMLVLDTAYRTSGPGAEGVALDNAIRRARTREGQAERNNVATQVLNNRIFVSLQQTTGQQVPDNPEAWWGWWNDHNQVFVEGRKPVQTARAIDIQEINTQPPATGGGGSGGPPQTACDCLAAGAPILTDRGMAPVESVQVGDLVLSQNAETGELAYKPVLRTTIRPRSPLLRIRCIGQELVASGGHKFYVAGEGWVRARDLSSGMELHTPSGALRVSEVIDDEVAESYNLIVADFGTYFVGPRHVLSHDNRIGSAIDTVVPGLRAP